MKYESRRELIGDCIMLVFDMGEKGNHQEPVQNQQNVKKKLLSKS